MSKQSISYKHYNVEGGEEEPRDIVATPAGEFFQSQAVKDLLGPSDKPGLLEKLNLSYNAYVEEMHNKAEENAAYLLKQAISSVNTSIISLLFPPVQPSLALEEQIRLTYEAAYAAALWADKKADAKAKAWLVSVGEFAVSKVIETPWQAEIHKELYFLTLLSTSPGDFVKIKKDKKIAAYANDYIEELNSVRRDYPKNISSDSVSEQIKQYDARISAVHAKYSKEEILTQIKHIDDIRKNRQASYGFFGSIINFFKFAEKSTLATLNQKNKADALREVLIAASNANAEVKERYINRSQQIAAKRIFDKLSTIFLHHPENMQQQDIDTLTVAVKALLNSKESAQHVLAFIAEAKEKIANRVSHSRAESVDQLANVFAFFSVEATKDNQALEAAKKDVISAIKNKLNNFSHPQLAINYINALLTKAKPEVLGDPELNIFIELRLNQYQALHSIKEFKRKVEQSVLSDEEMGVFSASLTSLLSDDNTEEMTSAVSQVIKEMQKEINYFFNLRNPSAAHLERAKKYFPLFQLATIQHPANAKWKILADARCDITDKVTVEIKEQDSALALRDLFGRIQSVWPEAIDASFIEIENLNDTPLVIRDHHPLVELTEGVKLSVVINSSTEDETRSSVELPKECTVNVGSTIDPKQKRVFRCSPAIKDVKLQTAISEKANLLLADTVATIEGSFNERVKYLKTARKGFLATAWQLITGETQTVLTAENQEAYVDSLVTEYIFVLNEQRLTGSPDERHWLTRRIVQDIEEVAEALNINFNKLLDPTAKQKLNGVDIGHLLLQWKFINKFRDEFGCTATEEAYRHAATGIIYKVDEIAKDDPRFIHQFLGNMTRQQLDAFYDTLVDAPETDDKDSLPSMDFVGDKQAVGKEGQTVLRKLMLLSSVSELVKQELVLFLNGNTVNAALFDEHVAFVSAYLPTLKAEAEKLNTSAAGQQIKVDLEKALAALVEADDVNQSKRVRELGGDLVPLANFIINGAEGKQEDKEKLAAFCKDYKFNMSTVIKEQSAIQRIAEDLVLAEATGVKPSDIFAKIDTDLLEIADVYMRRVLGHHHDVSLPDMKRHYAALEASYRDIHNDFESLDLVSFIKNLAPHIVDRLPSDLGKLVTQIQYTFADRFSTGISQILSKENLSTTEDVEAKLEKLKSGSFNTLVKQIFDRELDRKNALRVNKAEPHPLDVGLEFYRPSSAPVTWSRPEAKREHIERAMTAPAFTVVSNHRKCSLFYKKEDKAEGSDWTKEDEQRLNETVSRTRTLLS